MNRAELPSGALRDLLRGLAEKDAVELVGQAREAARARAQKLIEDALVEELLDAAARLRGRETASAPLVHGRETDPATPAVEPESAPATPAGEVESAPTTPADEQEGTPATPAGEQAADEPPSGHAWWTYGVLSAREAGELPPLDGIEPDTEIEVLSEGDLAALVSAVPLAEYGDERLREHLEDLDWVERVATRHEAVLEDALRRITIVPLRLCTLYHDQEGVRSFLREHGASLWESLRRVDGCAEWGVKLFADPRAGEAAIADGGRPEQAVPDDQEGVSERPGATYLIQRQRERERATRAAELRASCVDAVHDRVSRLAREAISNPPQRPEVHGRDLTMLLNGAYLVASERVGELHDTLPALQEEWGPLGFVIELTGPWPAYNFVSGAAGVMP